MKKRNLPILISLLVLLTGCNGYYHTGDNGVFLFIFLLIFILPLIGPGVPLLIRSIIGVKRKNNPKHAKAVKGLTISSILLGLAVTGIVLDAFYSFDMSFRILESRQYCTLQKAMKAATDEGESHFVVGTSKSASMYDDQDFVIRDVLMEIKDYERIGNRDITEYETGDLNYYIDLNKGQRFPFVQISFYEDGRFFIDYVKSESYGTASFQYKAKASEVNNAIEIAKERAKEIRRQREIERFYNEANINDFIYNFPTRDYFIGRIAANLDSGDDSTLISNPPYNAIEILKEMYYSQTSIPDAAVDKMIFSYAPVTENRTFIIKRTVNDQYFVELTYYFDRYKNDEIVETKYYSVNKNDVLRFYNLAIEYLIDE